MKNKLKLNSVIATAAVIICIVILNLIVNTIAVKKPLKIDITKDRIYSFSEQTEKLVKDLDKNVDIYAMYTDTMKSEYDNYVREYLKKYEVLSDKIKVTYVDIYIEPGAVKRFETDGEKLTERSIVVACGEKFRVLHFGDIYMQDQYDYSIYIDMESRITAAVAEVTAAKDVNVYFTKGHGESECSELRRKFEEAGYICDEVQLSIGKVPEDASMLVIAEVTKDFADAEIETLDKFADRGGQIMLLVSPGYVIPETFAQYLDDWGITLNDDYIVENDPEKLFITAAGTTIPAAVMQESPITSSLIERKMSLLTPGARSITLREQNAYYAQHTPLLTTTNDSWARINYTDTTTAENESKDKSGPLTTAVIAQKDFGNGEYARLFVFGSLAAVETEGILYQSSYANSDFIMNAAAYMTVESEPLGIRPRQVSASALTMTQKQINTVTIILYLLPLCIFAAGIVVWLRRRYK